MHGVFLENQDLQILFGIKQNAAYKKMRYYKDVFNKKYITAEEFCKFINMDYDFFLKSIATTKK